MEITHACVEVDTEWIHYYYSVTIHFTISYQTLLMQELM
jgi:hypothetical protein